jgi:hypothetical protein
MRQSIASIRGGELDFPIMIDDPLLAATAAA